MRTTWHQHQGVRGRHASYLKYEALAASCSSSMSSNIGCSGPSCCSDGNSSSQQQPAANSQQPQPPAEDHVIQYELVLRPDQAYIVQDFSPDVKEFPPWPASWFCLPRHDQAAVQFVQDLAQELRSGRSLLIYDRQGILTQ